MPTVKELLRAGRKDELWKMCCGFLDYNIDQFMAVQKSLLLEQIELLNNSFIGRKIFGETMPQDMDEFRKRVPLTTYADYCPELSEKMEDRLPGKTLYWQHSSGRSNEYPFNWEAIKWVPLTEEYARETGKLCGAMALISSCERKGDTSGIKPKQKFVYAVAPLPYTSGTYAYLACDELGYVSMPPLEEAQKLEFEERLALSFKEALSKGFDFYFGLTIALVAIGEKFNQQMGKAKIMPLLKQPRALLRIMGGLLKSKLAGRRLLPKDLFSVKGILTSGGDGTIFRDVIKETWGRYPLDVFVSTEAGFVATQTWDYRSMTFIPSLNFLEFLSEDEYTRCEEDKNYVPKTVLLNEVKPGTKYEMVISSFHGCPLIRYRTGDVITITSLRNDTLNINIPQMEFYGRVDDSLDIGGFIRLTERVVWQAVLNTGIPHVDWAARKEHKDQATVLHLYIEPKDEPNMSERQIAETIYTRLRDMDNGLPYCNVENVLNSMPVEVTFLPKGAFDYYISLRRAQGADLAHLKPRHMNVSDSDLSILLKEEAVAAQTASKSSEKLTISQ